MARWRHKTARDFLRACLRGSDESESVVWDFASQCHLARTISDPAGNVKLKKRQSDDLACVFDARSGHWI